MAEYDKRQRKPESRAIANNETGSRQLKRFVDNRSSSLKDKEIIDLIGINNDVPTQFYTPIKVAYNLGTEAKYAIAHRQKGYNYGSNIGYFAGGGYMYFGTSTNGHSEEQMLEKLGRYVVGRPFFDKKQDAAFGDGKPIKANMYTELQPCNGNYGPYFNCDALLDLALTDDSQVYYSFDRGTKIDQVKQSFE